LGKGRVEVMVLLSGTIGHYFTNSDIAKYPVREGGAFVHCDSSGKDEKNGMWVFNRGKGWHGSSREEVTLVFADRDNRELVIAFPKSVSEVQGNKLSVSAIGGFGPKKELVAIVTKKSEYSILEFTLHLPLSGLRQTAVIRKDTGFGGGYSITLKRRLSRKDTIVKPKKVVETDLHGMTVTGRGNVSKIGKLLPGPVHVDDLNCYAVPITS